jgi:DNA-directed RNA polymerase specialized sigma54-like protein
MVVREMRSEKGFVELDAETLLEQLRDVEALLETALDALQSEDPVGAERAVRGALDIVTDLILELEEWGEGE